MENVLIIMVQDNLQIAVFNFIKMKTLHKFNYHYHA